MAGWAGNVATFAFAKQSAKGTPAVASAYKTKFIGGDIGPTKTVSRLSETSGTRDQAASFVTGISVAGSPSVYMRTNDFAALAYYALGANADTGSSPYTHTATPVNTDLPYFTAWAMVAGALGAGYRYERFVDCKMNSLRISGSAGNPLTVEMNILGISPIFLGPSPTDDSATVTTQVPLIYDLVAVTKGGSSKNTVQSFDITIDNNLALMMGNGAITPYDIFPGQRTVSGTMTILHETNVDYLNFNYGTGTAPAGGATVAASRTLFQEALIFAATLDANNSMTLTVTNASYTTVPVAPDPGGAPIQSALAFNGEPGGNVCTIATKNINATVG